MSVTGEPFAQVNESHPDAVISEGMRRRAEQLARTMGASGAQAIAAERYRQQIAEGFTLEHDQEHTGGELVNAAITYLLRGSPSASEQQLAGEWWPWDDETIPPADSSSSALAKAGALIAAEIDRRAYAEAVREASKR